MWYCRVYKDTGAHAKGPGFRLGFFSASMVSTPLAPVVAPGIRSACKGSVGIENRCQNGFCVPAAPATGTGVLRNRAVLYGCFHKLGSLLWVSLLLEHYYFGSISGPVKMGNSYISQCPSAWTPGPLWMARQERERERHTHMCIYMYMYSLIYRYISHSFGQAKVRLPLLLDAAEEPPDGFRKAPGATSL